MGDSAESRKYTAFISYRHTDNDSAAARLIQNWLETCRIPEKLDPSGELNQRRTVFLDVTELTPGKSLNDEIIKALENSGYLIVICSHETPGSEWVAKEVSTFLKWGRGSRIIPVLIEGTELESFPSPLLAISPKETEKPSVIDASGRSRSVTHRLREKKSLILSTALGLDHVDFRREFSSRTFRLRLMVSAILLAVSVLFGLFTAWQLSEKTRQMSTAKIEMEDAMEKENLTLQINYRFLSILPYKLGYQEAGMQKLYRVFDDNVEQLKKVAGLNQESYTTQVQVLQLIALIRQYKNEYDLAEQSLEKALPLALKQAGSGNADALKDLSVIYRNLGILKQLGKQYADAEKFYIKAADAFAKLPAKYADKEALAGVYLNLAKVDYAAGDLIKAAENYTKCIDIFGNTAAADIAEQTAIYGAEACEGLAVISMASGDLSGARDYFDKSLAILEDLKDRDPADPDIMTDLLRRELAADFSNLAQTYAMQGSPVKSLECQQETVDIYKSAFEKGYGGEQLKEALTEAYHNLSEYNLLTNHPRDAIDASLKAIALASENTDTDNPKPKNPKLLINLAHGYLLDGQYEKAMAIYTENRGKQLPDKSFFIDVVLADLRNYIKNGVDCPYIEKALEQLSEG